MLQSSGQSSRKALLQLQARRQCQAASARCLHSHKPALLSKLYVPTSKVSSNAGYDGLKSVHYLQKAGFIRQSSAGIFSLLPFAQRVLDKLERIIEEEMLAIDASKVTLPNLLTPALWRQSGRWDSTGSELFRLQDRKNAEMLLAPTHEEEITSLVAGDILSERQLPVRLFQIGRKFRDEARPRAGLLRGREFLMKDLYTFDASEEAASLTYQAVKAAYRRIFDRIGVPYAVADADTGNIGGSSSHEFHYLSEAGEDTLLTCTSCESTANSELAACLPAGDPQYLDEDDYTAHLFDLPDSRCLLAVITQSGRVPNAVKVRKTFADATTAQLADRALDAWDGLRVIVDQRCATLDGDALQVILQKALRGTPPQAVWPAPPTYDVVDASFAEAGDRCVECRAPLEARKAIEVGHTFLLGTRYSKALSATFARSTSAKQEKAFFQMGCYGIGVTRILAAIAEVCADERGLKWPVAVAPYSICLIPLEEDYIVPTQLGGANIVIDDRYSLSFGRRIKDAELVGYPYIAVMGRRWQKTGEIEVIERKTGNKRYSTTDMLQALATDTAAVS